MKLKNPMLVVTDIDRSVEFYKKVFGLHIIMDFGANKTLTGGLACKRLKHIRNLLVQVTFLLAATTLSFILRKMTLTSLLIS